MPFAFLTKAKPRVVHYCETYNVRQICEEIAASLLLHSEVIYNACLKMLNSNAFSGFEPVK